MPGFGVFRPIVGRPLRHPAISQGLFDMVKGRVPDMLRDLIVEAEPDPLLSEAKAKMESAGVSALNEVGSLRLRQHITIRSPGLITPRGFRTKLLQHLGRSGVQFLNAPRHLLMATAASWPQHESVILADELDLNHHTLEIDRRYVSHLWIVARRITASQGALITFTPLVRSDENVTAGTNASPNPGQPHFNRTARQSSSNHDRAGDGGDGRNGGDGRAGHPGFDAPELTIAALEIDAMPDIELPGQQGSRGGRGGRGARGGDGQRGRDSRSWRAICRRSVGYGGHGGDGGDGGRGGQGGDGGDGSHVTIATQADQITALVTHRPFILNNGPGLGGEPGPQGQPGERGLGGLAGYRTRRPCRRHTDRAGQNGQRGRSRGDKGPGSPGEPGQIEYATITEDQWNLLLHAPWITSISPSEAVAGDTITIHGLHFVSNSQVLLDGTTVPANFNYDQQMSFTLPLDTAGGERTVQVRTPDGETSNEQPLRIRPHLETLLQNGTAVTSSAAGDTLTLQGRSFLPDSIVERSGTVIESHFDSTTEMTIVLPTEPGEDSGGQDTFRVVNPDGLASDTVTVTRLPSVDSGFRSALHGYPFHNFTIGDATWGAFTDTFGTTEVTVQSFRYPVLTGAFYLFFRWFLRNNAHCTGLASTSLHRYHSGESDLFSQYPSTVGVDRDDRPDPPDIPDDVWRDITVAQGRTLSSDLVVHYADQGREGQQRIETTLREIETALRNGLSESQARVLCYIPSGSVWDLITDSTVREAFLASHCVTPTRLVYGDANRNLDGARLYVYENNRPGEDHNYIEFYRENGELKFRAPYSDNWTVAYRSENGFTLGTNTLQNQLLESVSLPFSGGHTATAGLMRFALDLVLSPARVQVEDASGRIAGLHNGKMHTDPELAYVNPWLDNYVLVREDAENVKRTIVGTDSGTYTYMSLLPDGQSVALKDAACTSDSRDEVVIGEGLRDVSVKVSQAKTIELHLGEEQPDGVVRHISVKTDLEADETAALDVSAGFDGIDLNLPNRDVTAVLEMHTLQGENVLEEKTLQTVIPAGKHAHLHQGLWHNLADAAISID